MEESKLSSGGIVDVEQIRRIGDTVQETVVSLDHKGRPVSYLGSVLTSGIISKAVEKAVEELRQKAVNAPDATILDRIYRMFKNQTYKGLNKYGHTLDACPDEKFDWKLMAMEEMADCIQYLIKENMRLENEKNNLERMLNP